MNGFLRVHLQFIIHFLPFQQEYMQVVFSVEFYYFLFYCRGLKASFLMKRFALICFCISAIFVRMSTIYIAIMYV